MLANRLERAWTGLVWSVLFLTLLIAWLAVEG
jgi:hypothetical protein